MEEKIRQELEEQYIKYGNINSVIKLSQYLDKIIIEKQRLEYENYNKS